MRLTGATLPSGARVPLTLVTLLGALFVFFGADARADPSFVLGRSAAGPGESVSFSISGTETRGTYKLEVDGERVAAGSLPADSGVSGAFTMPDLGDQNDTVTVEAEIKQSDETATQARKLQYLARSIASTGPAAPQPAPVAAPVHAQSTHPGGPAPSSQSRKPPRRPAPPKRHATRWPQRAPEHPAGAQRVPQLGHHSGLGSRLSASPAGSRAGAIAPRSPGAEKHLSTAGQRPPSRAGEHVGSGLATLLTGPPGPAIFSLASGVAEGSGGDAQVAASIVALLLGLTALTIAGPGLAPRWRPRRVKRRAPSRKSRGSGPFGSAAGPLARVPSPPDGREAWDVLLQKTAASFAPIPLAVLDQQATLATRSERKYILNEGTFERLVGEVGSDYLILEIDGGRVFPYDTVYFDTPDLTTYRQHLQGRRKRFKCRTRLYSASELCFFEVKLKGRRGETIKRRLEVAVEQHGSLTPPALGFLDREVQQAYGTCPPAGFGPVLRTLYRRLTLAGRTNTERLTFDFELMFAANGKEYSIRPGRILLEMKTGTGAGAGRQVNSVLQRLGVRPVETCSKYCLGVALSHSELPDNPFRPLVYQNFDASRPAGAHAYDLRALAPPALELGEERQPIAPPLRTWREGTV